MDNQIADKVFQYIDALAQKLGVTADYVFSLLVQQKMTEGIVYGITFIVASIIIGTISYKVIRYTTSNWDKIYDDDTEAWWTSACVILGIVPVVLFVLDLTVLPNYLMQIFNPKYYAIKEILDTLKPSS